MLKKVQTKSLSAAGARFAIVAAQFNASFVDSMLAAAQSALVRAHAGAIDTAGPRFITTRTRE